MLRNTSVSGSARDREARADGSSPLPPGDEDGRRVVDDRALERRHARPVAVVVGGVTDAVERGVDAAGCCSVRSCSAPRCATSDRAAPGSVLHGSPPGRRRSRPVQGGRRVPPPSPPPPARGRRQSPAAGVGSCSASRSCDLVDEQALQPERDLAAAATSAGSRIAGGRRCRPSAAARPGLRPACRVRATLR